MLSLSAVSLLACALAQLVSGTPIVKRDNPLAVAVSPGGGNAVVNIAVTNTGSKDLNVLNLGTFLADAPIEKVDVYRDDTKLDFHGLYLRYAFDNLDPSAFTLIPAGQTVTKSVELAGLYDFTENGKYKIVAHGALSFVEANTGARISSLTSIPEDSQAVPFDSNELEVEIDAAATTKVETLKQALEKRVVLQSCSGSRLSAMQQALRSAVTIANQAATAASSGNAAKFNEFYKSTSSSVRSAVAARFRAIASAASSTNSGTVRYYCNDDFGNCSPNVIAWTQPSTNIIANCDYFYNNLQDISGSCNGQDRAGTVIHEMTHAPAIYSPYCQDYAYGYAQSTALSASQAQLNADTFALYSKHIYLGC